MGDSERGINTVDADGVALAAIQGLYVKLQAQEAEIRELRAALRRLENRVARPRNDPME